VAALLAALRKAGRIPPETTFLFALVGLPGINQAAAAKGSPLTLRKLLAAISQTPLDAVLATPSTTQPTGPTPTQPATPKTLHLTLTNDAPLLYVIDEVTWHVFRQEISGFSRVAVLSGPSASVTLAPAPQFQLRADVIARSLLTGERELADFRGQSSVDGVPTHLFVLATDRQQNCRLVAQDHDLDVHAVVFP
jgi:hypothetical protein